MGNVQYRQGEAPFPRDGSKTYALMGLMRGTTDSVSSGPRGTVMAWPRVFVIEFAIWSALIFAVILLSVFVNASLGPQADASSPPNPALMPWYLASIQELTLHIHPVFGGIMIPSFFVVGLIAIPFIDTTKTGSGVWFGGRKGARVALGSAIVAATILVILEWLDAKRNLAFRLNEALDLTKLTGGETPQSWPEGFGFFGFYDLTEWSSLLWAGVVPFLVLAVLLVLIAGAAKFVFRCSRREVLISVFTAGLVAVVLLSFVGSSMRGTDTNLYPPWDRPEVIDGNN